MVRMGAKCMPVNSTLLEYDANAAVWLRDRADFTGEATVKGRSFRFRRPIVGRPFSLFVSTRHRPDIRCRGSCAPYHRPRFRVTIREPRRAAEFLPTLQRHFFSGHLWSSLVTFGHLRFPFRAGNRSTRPFFGPILDQIWTDSFPPGRAEASAKADAAVGVHPWNSCQNLTAEKMPLHGKETVKFLPTVAAVCNRQSSPPVAGGWEDLCPVSSKLVCRKQSRSTIWKRSDLPARASLWLSAPLVRSPWAVVSPFAPAQCYFPTSSRSARILERGRSPPAAPRLR